MEEFERRMMGMLTTGVWCKQVSNIGKRGGVGLGKRGFRLVAAFWAGIPVEVSQQTGVVPRCKRAAIGTPF